MCIAQFFGDLSLFQIIVSAVALVNGGYTLYTFLRKANISMYPGDAVRIVVSSHREVLNLHLMCNLVNKSAKVGTVHRLEARVRGPGKTDLVFTWGLFYKYQRGGVVVEKDTDIYPVAVPKMDSKLLFVEFQTDPGVGFEWQEGEYEFEVIGWVNKKNRQKRSNVRSLFHIRITEDLHRQLNPSIPPAGPVFVTVPVIEWERQHR
jgi:hypothetical protein